MHEEWQAARRVAEQQEWLITAAQLRALNLSASQVATWLRSGGGYALLRGVYLFDADMYDDLPERVWWRAVLLRHGPKAVLVGRSGARAMGMQGLPPSDPALEVALVGGPPRVVTTMDLPGGEGSGPRVVVRQWPVTSAEVLTVGGLRVRVPSLTVVDAALQLDRVHALCLLDSALYLDLVTEPELATAVAGASHRRGCRRLREVAALADGRAESPLESRLRLACIDADLAPDDLQYEVKTERGIVVAVGDLAWYKNRRRPLLAEADGESVHGLPKAVFRDRRRGNAITGRACDSIRFTWKDTMRPAYVAFSVRSALAANQLP